MLFRGAAPSRGDLRTSPGGFSGEDHGWITTLIQPYIFQFFEELAKYPNRPTIPSAGSGFQKALMAEAKKCGWVVISMKRDFKKIFAWE
jgi:hypothetical protein